MSTIPRSTQVGQRLYRLNTDQYDAMIGAGVFPDSTRVELLNGLLVRKMTKYRPHSIATGQTQEAIARRLPDGWYVDVEQAVELNARWRPEPDLSIVQGRRADYPSRPPEPNDLAFLIEVADTSYPLDRGKKWRGYASANVGVYWIINLNARRVEVYADPGGSGLNAVYRSVEYYEGDAEVPLVIQGQEVGRIAVRDMLP